jgi:hypothetical protein
MIQIFALSTNIVCFNTNVQCKSIMFSYTVFTILTSSTSSGVLYPMMDSWNIINEWMNECELYRNV